MQGEKVFVSGGWAFVHPDSSMDVVAAEGVPVADIGELLGRTGPNFAGCWWMMGHWALRPLQCRGGRERALIRHARNV